ncbi:MAG: Sapep family Mn(2+)-dependent dipeptidase [Fimbriimonadaceae bacterium]|nr:Sapep family Mn(2+)-dependent dipeptidase [Fimbriimonadaceae bacterium]
MPDPIVSQIQDWLRAHESELLADTQTMLRFASIEGASVPNAPFGKENREALDFALSLCDRWGFKTKDLEGFAGWGEFGSGDRLVVSLGHLDVVPVGEGWKHQPFGAEIDGDYIYSRGAEDDKGPTMASLYAMRALKEVCPDLGVRFRQVFGCDEESGFLCVERYMKTEEAPTLGIAPDSGYPCYHAEKGIADLVTIVDLLKGEFELLEVSGGQRPNIVIDACEANVRVADSVRKHVDGKLADAWDANVKWEWLDDVLIVKAKGKAAHGSTPFAGDNAATRVFRFLLDIAPLSAERYFQELLWLTHPSGVGLGIHGRDDVSQDLTSNLGIVETKGTQLSLLTNVRYPVTWKGEELAQKCRDFLKTLTHKFELEVVRDSPSLYFPLDHPLVKTICEVVEEETGETRAPGVMGGGTYARAIPNTVSIGTGWEGDGKAHETDERLKVEHLFKMSRIYGHILYRLATVEL